MLQKVSHDVYMVLCCDVERAPVTVVANTEVSTSSQKLLGYGDTVVLRGEVKWRTAIAISRVHVRPADQKSGYAQRMALTRSQVQRGQLRAVGLGVRKSTFQEQVGGHLMVPFISSHVQRALHVPIQHVRVCPSQQEYLGYFFCTLHHSHMEWRFHLRPKFDIEVGLGARLEQSHRHLLSLAVGSSAEQRTSTAATAACTPIGPTIHQPREEFYVSVGSGML